MLLTFFCRPLPAGYLKCTHMHAHTKSLPSGQAIFKKMYTFAGIFFRWFYVYTCILSFSPLPILPAFFRSRHTHKNTPLPPSAIYFLHLFFFVSPNDRQKWQLRKILHKTKQEDRRTKENRKNTKIKEFVETKKCFRKPRFSPHVDKKQKKNKEKQRVNKDKYIKIYKFYFQIKKIEKMDIL